MKKITLIFTMLFLAAFSWQSTAQLSYDNTCSTAFDDISATGAVVMQDDGVTPLADDGEGNITLPFSFTLDGVASTDLRVGNNGGVLFGVTTGDVSTNSVQTAPGFYPFADDLDSDIGSVVWETLGTAPDRRVVIMWNDRNHYVYPVADPLIGGTIELVLYETTNEIAFLYQDTDFGDVRFNDAVSAGIRVVGANGVYEYSTDVVSGATCIHWSATTCATPTVLATSNITTTSADLAWTDNAGTPNYEYVIQAVNSGVPLAAGTATTTNPLALSGLTVATQYEVYLRADCGGGDFSSWTKVNFVTDCLPYGDFVENFDTATVDEVPVCWSAIVNSTSVNARVAVRNNTANSEPNSLEFYNGDDTSETLELFLITPQLTDLPNDTHRIRFMASGGAEYGLLVGTMTDPTDATTFHPIAGGGLTVVAGFNQYTLEFTGSTTDTYIALRASLPTTYDTIKIDDFNWEPIPTCYAPTGLEAITTSGTTANISWTDGNTPAATEWEYVIQAAGTGEPATGTVTTSNPLTDTSLTAETDYEVYVRAKCGATEYSMWVGPVNITTPCASMTPDYTEDFTTYVPTCWVEATDGDPTTGPSGFGSSGWLAEEFAHNATSGLGAVNINLYFNNKSEWLISPHFDLSTGGYELVLDVALTNYNSAGTDTMGSDDEVQLVMSEDGGITWLDLKTWNVGNQPSNTGDTIILPLASTGTNVQFAFWASDGTVNDDTDYDFHFDNFIIRTPPSCYTPGSVAAMNVTDVSADLSWTDSNTPAATTWDVEWGVAGFAQGAGTMVAGTTDNPYALSGLTQTTAYEFYVRTVCSGVDQSDWIGPIAFTTLATPPSNDNVCDATVITVNAAPVVGNNVGGTAEASEPVPACWDFPGSQNTVWFKFDAIGPNAEVSTDFATALTDTSIAIYSATDCADFTTFTEVGCDEDGGTVQNYNSIASLTGLTVGDTYYVQVDGYNNGTNEFNIEVTGYVASLNELNAVGFNYYPNPVSNELTMSANENITSVSVFNMLGQEVRSIKPSALEANINMSDLSSGTYFVKAQVGTSVGTFKIIKK